MKTLYHVTTKNKLERYKATGCILSPVRGWAFLESAKAWAKKTGRDTIIELKCEESYPLPDHSPKGHAFWTPEYIRNYKVLLKN
jgi:hypothetical protein